METRKDFFKYYLKASHDNSIADFSYSAVLRYLRKNLPEKVNEFLKTYKESFDLGKEEKLDDVEHLALMEAVKTIGLKING